MQIFCRKTINLFSHLSNDWNKARSKIIKQCEICSWKYIIKAWKCNAEDIKRQLKSVGWSRAGEDDWICQRTERRRRRVRSWVHGYTWPVHTLVTNGPQKTVWRWWVIILVVHKADAEAGRGSCQKITRRTLRDYHYEQEEGNCESP